MSVVQTGEGGSGVSGVTAGNWWMVCPTEMVVEEDIGRGLCECKVHVKPQEGVPAGKGCWTRGAGKADPVRAAENGTKHICQRAAESRKVDRAFSALCVKNAGKERAYSGGASKTLVERYGTGQTTAKDLGRGYCYVVAFSVPLYMRLACVLGPNPLLADVMRVACSFGRAEMKKLLLTEVAAGYYHVTEDKSSKGKDAGAGSDFFSKMLAVVQRVPSARVGASVESVPLVVSGTGRVPVAQPVAPVVVADRQEELDRAVEEVKALVRSKGDLLEGWMFVPKPSMHRIADVFEEFWEKVHEVTVGEKVVCDTSDEEYSGDVDENGSSDSSGSIGQEEGGSSATNFSYRWCDDVEEEEEKEKEDSTDVLGGQSGVMETEPFPVMDVDGNSAVEMAGEVAAVSREEEGQEEVERKSKESDDFPVLVGSASKSYAQVLADAFSTLGTRVVPVELAVESVRPSGGRKEKTGNKRAGEEKRKRKRVRFGPSSSSAASALSERDMELRRQGAPAAPRAMRVPAVSAVS